MQFICLVKTDLTYMRIDPLFKSILLFVSVIFFCKSIDAAEVNLKAHEDSINHYFNMLAMETSDAEKIRFNQKILEYFRETLKNEESFDHPFSSLKNVGIITSEDNKLRIITWNLPYNDRTHKYYGFVQYKKSNRSYNLFELQDKSVSIKKPELVVLDHENWYGALYYSIITNKYKGTIYYTLLGADLNDVLIKKKVIDILYFSDDDQPVFGKRVFKNKSYPAARVIFEFNAQTSMTLTYDEEKEMIVFDHLSPSQPSLKGQYEFYGPDFSYDGLKFERGIWNAYTDIDVRDYNIE